MPNLYELTEDMIRLEDLIEDGDQEIDEEWLVSEWETLEGDINDKTERWLKVIKNHEADIKARKDAIDFVLNTDYATKTLRPEAFLLAAANTANA